MKLLDEPQGRIARRSGVALALGGGGARGLAHIVVLEALEDLGVRPVALAGTSMGAVIAAAAAAGMSGREIRAHALRALRSRRLVLSRMLQTRVGRFTDLLTRGLVNPVLVDAEMILPLFWPEAIPARFEDLAIPLSVTATDFNAREGVTIEDGALPSAVAGSIAVPGLIRPVLREGRLLVDGGVVNPLPYELLFDRASVVLACDVSRGPADTTSLAPKPLAVMLGSTQIMQAALTARMLAARPPHILLRPPVERFPLLDYFHAARILEAAETVRDEVKRGLDALLSA